MSDVQQKYKAKAEAERRFPITLPYAEHHATQYKKRHSFVEGAEWQRQHDNDLAKVLEECIPIVQAWQIEGSYQYLLDKIQTALKKHTDI